MFENDRLEIWPRREELDKRVNDIRGRMQALPALGVGHAHLGEEPARAAFGSERGELRVGAIHRHAESERQIAFERRRREGNEVSAVRITRERADLVDEARTLEELRRQGRRPAVVRAHEVKPSARMARDDARKQPEVIVDNARLDRLRGDVDDLRVRLAKEEKKEEVALLIRLPLR